MGLHCMAPSRSIYLPLSCLLFPLLSSVPLGVSTSLCHAVLCARLVNRWLIHHGFVQNLRDFKSQSCWTPFSYIILYCSVLISIAVYGVDTFTAVNLLAFSRWASQVKPKIPFKISKWIFAGCIILSFVLLIYRWIRAVRVMKSGGIAQSYLDPIALRVQSLRTGKKHQGWRRFLVFADLTKSKKGADYVALFTYFNFECMSIRVVIRPAYKWFR